MTFLRRPEDVLKTYVSAGKMYDINDFSSKSMSVNKNPEGNGGFSRFNNFLNYKNSNTRISTEQIFLPG